VRSKSIQRPEQREVAGALAPAAFVDHVSYPRRQDGICIEVDDAAERTHNDHKNGYEAQGGFRG
jgi:hypothetical protein